MERGFNMHCVVDSVVQGPSVLVVKDKDGCVYGGYASQPWEKHSDFYGDMKSFVFTLHPKAAVHRPTGKNANLQWVRTSSNSTFSSHLLSLLPLLSLPQGERLSKWFENAESSGGQ